MNDLRVLRPAGGVFAFYAGRAEGVRYSEEPNWVDAGALSLGIASYAIVSGEHALVYDTHVSVEHALGIRRVLEDEGVRRFTVVLSHWHLDHVAGTAAFDDCEVIACERTDAVLREHREAIEAGTLEGPPAVDPLVLPTTTFRNRRDLAVDGLELQLVQTEIHSDDAVVVWWPERGLLLCGDTLEDTVTYVDEPDRLAVHRVNLSVLRELGPGAILPNHGDPDVIAAGGYSAGLISATDRYLELLLRSAADDAVAALALSDVVSLLGSDDLRYFQPYEEVHRQNVERVRG